MYAKSVVDNICESERIQPTMTHAHSRGPEVTWTGSHVDRKSRGPTVTLTGSHVDRKSCGGPEVTRRTGSHAADRKSRGGPEVTRRTGSHAADRKSRGGPEVTRRTGSHVHQKSRGPEVTCTGSHVDRKSRGPEVTWTGRHAHRAHRSQIVATISLFTVIRPTPIATCPSLGHPSQGSGKKHCALRLPSLGDQARSPRSGNTIEPIGL